MDSLRPARPKKATSPDSEPDMPPLTEASRAFARIGLLSFGGPTAQIALMHRVLVEERKWLTESQFLNALSFCIFLPGPEAMQLATYAGWKLHRVLGGLIAGLLFVLPGAALVLLLSVVYAAFGDVPLVKSVFVGIQAAVVIIVVEALLRIGNKALNTPLHWWVALASFIAIFFFSVSFPVVILSAALFGYLFFEKTSLPAPQVSESASNHANLDSGWRHFLSTTALWLFIWFAPLILIAAFYGPGHVFTDIGIFFSKLAVVTFGGAYAVLAYMAQQAVQGYGWLSAAEMLDGLGLAETTNGPLILVTEFVGYLAGLRQGGTDPSIMRGMAGAAIALWVTFAPCFLWIFAGAPYVDRLQNAPKLQAALSGITAAVVGVILNLSQWFALHVIFEKVTLTRVGPLNLWIPELASVNWLVVVLIVVSGFAMLRLHLGIAWTLLLAGTLSLAWSFIA